MILSLKKFLLLKLFSFLFLLLFASESFATSYIDTKKFVEELKIRIENTNNIKAEDLFVEWNDEKLERKLEDLKSIYPNKEISIKVNENTIKNILGRSGFPLDIMVDGKVNRILFIKCKVEVLKETIVTSELIKKGEVIYEGNIKFSKMPNSKVQSNAILEKSKALGKVAFSDINPNTVLTSNLLKEKTVVFRGNQVTIRVINGDLILTSVGEVLQDGVIGQLIPVKITSFASKKTSMAKVIDSGLVEINLGGK
jgi:flagella basal body P-ring formation protein FlgA